MPIAVIPQPPHDPPSDSKVSIILHLAKAAHAIEATGEMSTVLQAGTAFEAALNAMDIPTRPRLRVIGKWPTSLAIFSALSRVDGGGYFGPSPDPKAYKTDLLEWFVGAADVAGHPWREGEDELKFRA